MSLGIFSFVRKTIISFSFCLFWTETLIFLYFRLFMTEIIFRHIIFLNFTCSGPRSSGRCDAPWRCSGGVQGTGSVPRQTGGQCTGSVPSQACGQCTQRYRFAVYPQCTTCNITKYSHWKWRKELYPTAWVGWMFSGILADGFVLMLNKTLWNVCYVASVGPMDWYSACIMTLYPEKCDKYALLERC